MNIWVVLARWPNTKKWKPVHVSTSLQGAAGWMDERYGGTVWERRVSPATVRR